MIDPFLLEAMREVDALTPACPPIAPPVVDEENGVGALLRWHQAAQADVLRARLEEAEMVEYADVARRARIRG